MFRVKFLEKQNAVWKPWTKLIYFFLKLMNCSWRCNQNIQEYAVILGNGYLCWVLHNKIKRHGNLHWDLGQNKNLCPYEHKKQGLKSLPNWGVLFSNFTKMELTDWPVVLSLPFDCSPASSGCKIFNLIWRQVIKN